MPWDPKQYDKYKAERSAPVNDLFALVDRRENISVIDLGCGTGEHTRRLHDLLPGSTVLGIDSSASMLDQSTQWLCDGFRTELGDLQSIHGEYDLIFSNAALQWCANHKELFPSIWSHLRPNGQLLVQMPKNQDHASHRLAVEIATDLWPETFAHLQKSHKSRVLEIEEYAELLFASGAHDINCFCKVYPHVLENSDAIVEWVKGTLLVPFREKLNDDDWTQFLSRYRQALAAELPGSPVFYGFKRILISARRAD